MNKNAKRWVKALRSGEFKQGQRYLSFQHRDGQQFDCCLGVACKLFNRDETNTVKLPFENINGIIKYGPSTKLLPEPLHNYLGITTSDGAYFINGQRHSLTNKNDNGSSFLDIADIIESEPDGLFVAEESPLTSEQQEFILYRLIPFILREQGDNFAMQYWDVERSRLGDEPIFDGVKHESACGSICCIGGSISHLSGAKRAEVFNFSSESLVQAREMAYKNLGAVIGLTGREAHGLFFAWMLDRAKYKQGGYGWPLVFSNRFAAAKNPLEKAEVACDLLRLIARVGPSVLDRSED